MSLIVGSLVTLSVLENILPGSAVHFFLCSVVAIAATHICCILVLQAKWHKQRQLEGDTVKPLSWTPTINIMVPAKNESRVIETCVRNLFKIDYPHFDVWVIDDNSSDDTLSKAQALQSEFSRLQVLHRPPGSKPGKSAALNDCLALCKGEVVAVFDADSYVEPDFFRRLLPVLSEEGVGAVQAQKRIYENQTGFLVDCQVSEYAFDTCLQFGRNLIGGCVELRGNGQLVKRSALIDVAGWNNNAITDDLDLSMRLLISRWDIKFVPDACVFEEAVPNFRALFRQRRRWAEGSIRRYLDYIIPLQLPSTVSMKERFDILAFLAEFAWPPLTFLAIAQSIAGHIDPLELVVVTMAGLITIFVPLYAGLRMYRKDLSPLAAALNTWIVNTYIFSLWCPCVMVSIGQILFRKETSAWKRTEHLGLQPLEP